MKRNKSVLIGILRLLVFTIVFWGSASIYVVSAYDTQYVYDSLNRLVEIHYPDKIIHYTYDDAGNRTGVTVETLTVSPSVINIDPASATIGANGVVLNVAGTNFNASSTVNWNGSNRPTSFVNVNQLTATISASDLETLGTATVTVLNSSPDIVSNAAFFTVQSGAGCVPVSISNSLTIPTTATASIPITVSDLSGKGIGAFDFVVSYNSAVIQPVVGNPTDTVGTLSSGSTLTVDTSVPGQLRVGGFRLSQYAGAGTLIKLNFQAVGAIGTSSPLTFGQFRFNESDPCTTVSNGNITIAANNQISGTVSYGIVGTQGLKRVQDVLFNASGTPSASGVSNSLGSYAISGLANGSYVVTGTKSGDVNGISAFDATLALRYVAAGGGTLTSNQQIAADTNGNGFVTSFDATQMLRYVAAGGSTAQTGFTGSWRLNPSSRTYSALSSSISNEDYDAMLIGEVNGNWTPPGAIADPAGENVSNEIPVDRSDLNLSTDSATKPPRSTPNVAGIQVSLPANASSGTGFTVSIPVTLTNNNSKVISGYSFAVLFDPTVLQPANPSFASTGTLSSTFNVVTDTNTAGRLGVASAGGNNVITGNGVLLNLRFNVIGALTSTTALTFSNVLFEDDQGNTIPANLTNGAFSVLGPSSASATVTGRIISSDGQPISNATILVTSTNGEIRTVRASSLGYYQIEGLAVGQTYSFSPQAKRFTFSPSVVVRTVSDNIDELDFVADP